MLRILRSRPLQVDILTAFAAVLVITVLLIVGYSQREDNAALGTLSESLIEQLSARAFETIVAHMEPAARSARVLAHMGAEGDTPLMRDQRLADYALRTLEAYPQLAACRIADLQGNLLILKRMPDGTVSTIVAQRNDSGDLTLTWHRRDEAGHVVRSEPGGTVKHAPLATPWYAGASAAGATFWTDVHNVFPDGKPGIDAAQPILTEEGAVRGVVAFEIDLEGMAHFLKRLEIGDSGASYIVNQNGKLVACSYAGQTVRPHFEGLRAGRIQEVETEWLRASYAEYQQRRQPVFVYGHGGTRYLASFCHLPLDMRRGWQLAVVVPEDDFIGGLKRSSRFGILMTVIFLLGGVLCASILARGISRPIVALAHDTERIRNFDLEETESRPTHIAEIQLMNDSITAMRKGLLAFRRYVPADLVRQLIRTGQEARLGGVNRELTICFTDIEGFTTLSESLDPEQLMLQLSEYLSAVSEVIANGRGTVDKYTGDGVMAFWGAPINDPDHARHACSAALACLRRVEELNARWHAEGKPEFQTRIGIHTGETIVGNVGSNERMNYTVLGDSVNLAARLEGVNKYYATRIIVSEATRERVAEDFISRPIDLVAVRGRKEGVLIHELLTESDAPDADRMRAMAESFQRDFEAYRGHRWAEALQRFESAARVYPNDEATAMYVERCRRYVEHPPREDGWEEIIQLSDK